MKSKLGMFFATVLLSVTVIGLSHGLAYAQTDELLKANIPFSFNAGKQVMPAGTYTIGIDVQNNMIRIADAEGRNLGLMVGSISGYGSEKDALIFDHTADDQYYLKGLESDLVDLNLPVNETQTAHESADAAGPEQVQVSMGQ